MSENERKNIESKVARLKDVLKKQDAQADEIQKAIDELTQASYKLAEEVYKSSANKGAQQGPQAGAQAGPQTSQGTGTAGSQSTEAGGKSSSSKDGEVIDADYKEEKK